MVAFDEMSPENSVFGGHTPHTNAAEGSGSGRLTQKMRDAELVFRKTASPSPFTERKRPPRAHHSFDIVPRIISGPSGGGLTQGIEQRVQALNAFLDDIYHRQEILGQGAFRRN